MRALYGSDRAAGFPESRLVPLTRRDGSSRLVEFAAWRDGQCEAWLLNEVSERAASGRFRVIFEHSSDAQLLCDETGILDCNHATVEMLGCGDKSQVREATRASRALLAAAR